MQSKELDELAEAYYQQIILPSSARAKPQFSVALIGLIGSGKTTVLHKLCSLMPLVRISGDEARQVVRQNGYPNQPADVIAKMNHRLVLRLRKQGYRLAYDNDFANPNIRSGVVADNQTAHIPLFWLHVTAPKDVIIQRLKNRGQHYLGAEEALSHYSEREKLHMQQAAELAKLPYVYTFDTAKPDLDLQIEEAVRRIKKLIAG